MAYLPYGYKIENGVIRIDEEKKNRLLRFFRLYISGASIAEASDQLPLSLNACTRLLDNRVYLGTEQYPPLIDEELFKQLHDVRLERKMEAARTGHFRKTLPILTCFRWVDGPWETIQDVYDCIMPTRDFEASRKGTTVKKRRK